MARKPLISSTNNPINLLWLNDKKIGPKPEVKVTIYDYEKNPIKNYSRLTRKPDENKIDIFLDFFVKDRTTEIEEDELLVEYRLKDKSSKDSYLRNKNEALAKHIYEYLFESSGSYAVEKAKIKNDIDDELECKIVKLAAENDDGTKRDEIMVKLRKRGDSPDKDLSISMKNIRLIPNFNVPSKLDEVITFSSPLKEPKPF